MDLKNFLQEITMRMTNALQDKSFTSSHLHFLTVEQIKRQQLKDSSSRETQDRTAEPIQSHVCSALVTGKPVPKELQMPPTSTFYCPRKTFTCKNWKKPKQMVRASRHGGQ